MSKPFIAAFLRDVLDQYNQEQISFSRMVEMLNERAAIYSESKNKELGVELGEIKNAFQWTWDNMGTPHTPDHFNIPANGIHRIELLMEELTTTL